MSRSEGLVQRKNASQAVSSLYRSDEKVEDDEKVVSKKEGEEVADIDSKEARLTLMEEVLLLGLKDKEVQQICDYKN